MRFRLLITAVALLGALFLGTTARADDRVNTLTARAETASLGMNPDRALAGQYAGHTGETVALSGTVSGIIPRDGVPAFLLEIDPQQTVMVTFPSATAAIAPGEHVNVTARIPSSGYLLGGIQVTGNDPLRPTSMPKAYDETQATIAKVVKSVTEKKTTAKQTAKSIKSMKATATKSATAPGASDYAQKIRQVNSSVSKATALRIANTVLVKSKKYGVDPRLVFAMLAQESRFDSRAVSYVGAQGLGQLMPGTARMLGVNDAFNVEQNIDGSIRYLAAQLKQFGGDFRSALAAYNAGPGNVMKYGGIPPFKETRNYVRVITTTYQQLRNSL